jgi:hypothetical protein
MSKETATPVKLVLPTKRTILCKITNVSIGTGSKFVSKDGTPVPTKVVSAITLGDDSQAILLYIKVAFWNPAKFDDIIFIDNVVSVDVESHIPGVSGYVENPGDLELTAYTKSTDFFFISATNGISEQYIDAYVSKYPIDTIFKLWSGVEALRRNYKSVVESVSGSNVIYDSRHE